MGEKRVSPWRLTGPALILLATAAAACGNTATTGTGSGDVPPPLYEPAMGFDAASGQLIMFGGAASRTYGDTWQWDGDRWQRLAPHHAPSPRQGAAMAYDPISRRLLLYGGSTFSAGDETAPLQSPAGTATNRVFSDTWAWDGQDWTQLAPSGNSSGESPWSLLAFDMADRVMIRQVLCPQFCAQNGSSVFAWRAGGWVAVAAGVGPTNETGQSDTYPPAADLKHPAYDPADNIGPARALAPEPGTGGLLYVERTDGAFREQPNQVTTLRYVSGRWQRLAPATSPSRYPLPYAVMTPDSSGGDVLFDGLGDTAVWDGSTWTAQAGVHPPVRAGAAMAYDARTRQVVLYGGVAAKPGGIYADTWTWDGHAWHRAAGPASAMVVPSAWTQDDPDTSLNRFSRADVMAMAHRAFSAHEVTRVEAKLVRLRDAVAMGIGEPATVPWWDPRSYAGVSSQPGRLEWVIVAFCDHPGSREATCSFPATFPPDHPLLWTAMLIDAEATRSIDQAVTGFMASGGTSEPKGWAAAADLSAGGLSRWVIAGGALGAGLAVGGGLAWSMRRRRRLTTDYTSV